MLVMAIIGAAVIYPYCFVTNNGIIGAAFVEQFCVQGGFGVIPIYLMELSPGSMRSFVVGTSYQLGNLISSASTTIEAKIGERFPLPPLEKPGQKPVDRFEYGKVMCIFMGCVYAYMLILIVLGPEKLGKKFGLREDQDFQDVVRQDDDTPRHDEQHKHA